ncbi:MAG: inorganic diphosphatase [Alphaproteobacteria bacterium]|nr:inorganic diphosphatase [Alphaproteobacteria bacterium]
MPLSWSRGALPAEVEALVEVPRGSFLKRELHEGGARLDFISPLPCPFNYGCVPHLEGLDGDPLDAVILGSRLDLGTRVRRPVVAIVRFEDGGQVDDKLVLSDTPLSRAQLRALRAFFRGYALARRLMNLKPGARRGARFLGVDLER